MQALFLVTLWALGLAQQDQHPIRKEIVDSVNQENCGWTAVAPEKNPLAKHTIEELRGMMGLLNYGDRPVAVAGAASKVGSIPEAFDARHTWPSCQSLVRDQANCGSCWAFGAAETLTDNLCVLGISAPVLSPQDLVSCDTADHGCNGGSLLSAWSYIEEHGLVSDGCIPYASGDGSNHTCALPGCSSGTDATTYKCPVTPTELESDTEIQSAVMTVGAVEVGFYVMEDFMNYQSGVYKYQSGVQLGGHAVKIVGWGQEGGFYWTVQNSWGASWGESGFFRIRNWHDDKVSGFAIAGGHACVQGSTPAPPSPPTPPPQCDDIVGFCSEYDHTTCAQNSYVVPLCKKTCGCCEHEPNMRPSYCANAATVVV
eukprot:NODE_10593_length_1341_cov_5.317957.p1 GENE.NODE_10593_length_1341_cov_5.317957~~NODE_10593_length_1341_cov_5.317957.p1  ORF type:complete len:400 (+),score=42.83 NODE_10593_length_1341_cov_5.317957:93-1202(+)